MAIDPKKRQKKLERHKAKRKAEKHAVVRRGSQGMPARLERAAAAPVLHCCAATIVWEGGMGPVLFSRQLPNGDVAFVNFLLDIYCLGVKDVIVEIMPRAVYEARMYDKLCGQYEMRKMEPAAARKLIEGAVEYAHNLGLAPHPDYRVAKFIFGGVSAEACSEEFVYGLNGKPFFIQGPFDDDERCAEILRAIAEHSPNPSDDQPTAVIDFRHLPRGLREEFA